MGGAPSSTPTFVFSVLQIIIIIIMLVVYRVSELLKSKELFCNTYSNLLRDKLIRFS